MSNELIRIAAEGYLLSPVGAHGPIHWARVIDNGRLLARKLGVNPRVPELFGAFHDCRRLSEGHDDNHGVRGSEALKVLAPRDGLTTEEFSQVILACDHHTTTYIANLPIAIKICLDADRLDLLRVGVVPDAKCLFTEAAKSLIPWANERAKYHTPPEWLTHGNF